MAVLNISAWPVLWAVNIDSELTILSVRPFTRRGGYVLGENEVNFQKQSIRKKTYELKFFYTSHCDK